MGFLGQYEHTLDAKNRLTIPRRFRGPLSDGLVLARAVEPCVAIYTPAGWEQFTREWLRSQSPWSSQARRVQRYFNAYTFESTLDAAGRIMLPPALIRHAGLRKPVLVIGNDASVEVWDPESWERYQGEADIADEAQRLARGDL